MQQAVFHVVVFFLVQRFLFSSGYSPRAAHPRHRCHTGPAQVQPADKRAPPVPAMRPLFVPGDVLVGACVPCTPSIVADTRGVPQHGRALPHL